VWIFSGNARQRQARGLLGALPREGPEIVAGDFNTWFGYRDPAYRAMAAAFPHTTVTDRRATFAGLLRLDHMFFGLPADWTSSFARLNDRFGSDHYPLLGWVHFRHAGESRHPPLSPS
jgi:endonuclease/exonuclease/phosphatase family metal-dependent hydrolase